MRLLTASKGRSCGAELKKPTCAVEVLVEVLPELGNGELSYSLLVAGGGEAW